MKEDQLIELIRKSLDNSSQNISYSAQEKLRQSRTKALKLSHHHLINQDSTITLGFSNFKQQWVAVLGSLVLISAIATYSAWIHEQNEDDQGFLDAKLLSSDMPLQVLANPELSQWLEN